VPASSVLPTPGARAVGFVLHSAKRDGAGLALLELLDALGTESVRPFATLPKAGPLVEDLRGRGVPVAVVPYRWWLDRATPGWKKVVRSAWNVGCAVPLARRLRAWGCDVVYTNTLTVVTGALAAARLGLPHVWHAHELWGGATGFEFDLGEPRSLALIDRHSAVCVAVSRAVADRLAAGLTAARVRVVYQSVSVPAPSGATAPLPPRRARFVCAMIGTLFPLKFQAEAIAAIGELRGIGVDAELWLVGDGEPGYMAHLRSLASRLGLEERVKFLGFRSDRLAVLAQADVLLNCSPLEACNRATVEAMLLGKPVVAARGGGNDELVREDDNGLLYRHGDPADLAARLARLARCPEDARALGERGRRWATATFGRERYGAELGALLNGLAAGRRHPRIPG
jgi:glycosyltransferase involved in cell wall biosynthesis